MRQRYWKKAHKLTIRSSQEAKFFMVKVYEALRRMPVYSRYSVGIGLIIVGLCFVPFPFLPGRALIGPGVGVFAPGVFKNLFFRGIKSNRLTFYNNLYAVKVSAALVAKPHRLKHIKHSFKRRRHKKMKQ